MQHSIFATKVEENAESRLYKIINLCKVGAASTDTAVNVDLSQDGHCEMYEVIYSLASEAIDLLETKPVP